MTGSRDSPTLTPLLKAIRSVELTQIRWRLIEMNTRVFTSWLLIICPIAMMVIFAGIEPLILGEIDGNLAPNLFANSQEKGCAKVRKKSNAKSYG